ESRFFVYGEHVNAYFVRAGIEAGTAAAGVRICARIQPDAGPFHTFENARAHFGHVLADAATEGDAVTAAERGEVGAEILARAVAIELYRFHGRRRALRQELADRAAPARDAEQAGLPVQSLDDLTGGLAEPPRQPVDDRRIDIPARCGHRHALVRHVTPPAIDRDSPASGRA